MSCGSFLNPSNYLEFRRLVPTVIIRRFRARDLARNRLEGKFPLLLKIIDSQVVILLLLQVFNRIDL